MLSPIKTIKSSGIDTQDTRYAWDEWDVHSHYHGVDEDLLARLEKLTDRANLALTFGCGEWICQRFSKLDSDPNPLQLLEACWAGVIHPAYCQYTEIDEDNWRGPIRGPLAVTMVIAIDALFCFEEQGSVALRAAWMITLARHLLPSIDAFDAWLQTSIERLERWLSEDEQSEASEEEDDEEIDAEDLFSDEPVISGRPVPRQILDPDFDYNPDQADELLDQFLRDLDPIENEYLYPTDELEDVKSIATPYRYP